MVPKLRFRNAAWAISYPRPRLLGDTLVSLLDATKAVAVGHYPRCNSRLPAVLSYES